MLNQKSPARILVVEDEAIISADIQERLRLLGYEVVGAADTAREAVQKAAELKPDLILMDIVLKGENSGIEAADEIRSQLHLPVIYLTANTNETTFARARDTGPFGFISKPFEDITVKNSIEIALYKHQMDQEREDLIHQLQDALAQVKNLSGLLPICTSCNKIRDDEGGWNKIESYIVSHSNASFSHGYCPRCAVKFMEDSGLNVPPEMREAAKDNRSKPKPV